MKSIKKSCAVVFGSHFNSYSILQELDAVGVSEVVLIHSDKGLASYSNIPVKKIKINEDYEHYYSTLSELSQYYEKLVLYPSNDEHLEFFFHFYHKLIKFCYVPINYDSYLKSISKFNQYGACEELDVPFPKTVRIQQIEDLDKMEGFSFPLIVKPIQRQDLKMDTFRNITIDSLVDLSIKREMIAETLNNGFELIISEIIPGDTNGTIYAYCAFRSPKSGIILNEWTGKKLSQHPNDYGVFSSASNEAPELVKELGRKLVLGMNLSGFIEPEFKFDFRDGKYKLMEINLRPMMWNRIGLLSGVKLHYTQWLDANDLPITKYHQQKNDIIHFYYLRHELNNLRNRKDYKKIFNKNLFGGDQNSMAVWNSKDLKPFFYDLLVTVKNQFKS